MKIILRYAVLLAVMVLLPGCAGCQQEMSHLKSRVTGLKRHVTLYSNTGAVIKEWNVDCQVEDTGGSCRFLTPEGKAVVMSGTWLIEGK